MTLKQVPGLIPAWAGKTCVAGRWVVERWAHPRVGGENRCCVWPAVWSAGSSPRGRGKLIASLDWLQPRGLIPAWAGKTPSKPRAISQPGAHPRVGGENNTKAINGQGFTGSSPRGRGKLQLGPRRRQWRGLIPAWAGKTHGSRSALGGQWAHPRVGGENHFGNLSARNFLGSSPRGRGKLAVALEMGWPEGLIPAWAGKTSSRSVHSSSSGAHPRVGGENGPSLLLSSQRTGSSPRGRGKLRCQATTLSPVGLIPAWAGKTQGTRIRGVAREAHPRVGGENSKLQAALNREAGSSPRGRGKHSRCDEVCNATGLIPAWAGKTC